MATDEFPRPDAALIARLSKLATSTLANALDEAGLYEQVLQDIAPVAPSFRFCGPAVTVQEISGRHGSFTSADFKVGAMIDAAGPGDVILVAAEGARASTWGGMASYAAKLKGVAGLAVDGGVRDLEEIVGFAFPVFARHLVPTTGRSRLKVEAINVPVRAGGVAIAPGDILVADGTGLVALPRDRAAEIAALAESCARDDAAAMKDLAAGLSFTEAMAKYKKI